jgi:hypothetical protein
MTLTTRRILLVLASLLLTLTQVGCGSGGKSVVRGRVITGTVGQAVSTNAGDERFEEPGVPGMEIAILARGGSVARGRGIYAKATSDEFGEFELVFPSGTFPSDAVEIQVSGEGVFTAKSTTYMPTQGARLLCIVIPRPGYVAPERNLNPEE